MAINLGSSPIAEIKLGSTPVEKALLGTTLVWPFLTTLSGIPPIIMLNALERYVYSLTQTGKCEQNGTPTPDSPVDIVCNNGVLKVGRESYTTPLGRTVYGGTLNVTTGVLTVDMAIVDMGTLNWMYYSAQKRLVAQVNSAKPAGSNTGLDGACSVYKVVNTAYRLAPDKSIIIGNNFISNSYAAMVVHDEDYTDAETFKTAVSGHTLVYPIKTPVTYQLSPQEVEMIAERSTFQSNANGNIDITYYANGILKTVSGNPVVITDADGQNAEDVTVHIEPIQSGSGTPSPTNIRPISGMTDINITRLGGVAVDGTPEVLTVTGKNLFGLKQWLDSLNVTYTQQGEKFTITSNGSLYANPWVFSDTDVEVKFSCKSFTNETATRARITFLDTGGNVVSSRYADDVLTLNVTASKCRFDWASGGTFSIEEAQIELGSTATAYEPYVEPQTATVENLYAVDNIADEQDIITGKVIRRTEAVVSDGTTPSGRYVGEVGVGNIIVKARETGYSGEIVSFTTEEETPLNGLRVNFSPIQDLHGYDAPWPAGGGKNKLPNENGTYKGTTGNNIYIVDSVSLPAGTYYIKYFADKSTGLALAGFYLSINGGTASRVGTNHAMQEAVESFVLAEQSNITLRLYSSTAGFNEAKYRFMLTVEDSTNIAYAPYSNICPISGWTGCNVTRAGKNLLQNVNGNVFTTRGVTFTKRDDGSIALSGTATANVFYNVDFVSTAVASAAPFDLIAFRGKVIVASLLENAVSGIGLTVSYFKQDGTYGTLFTTVNASSGTVPADAWKDRTYIKVNAGTNTNGVILYPKIELGSTATAYEPYTGSTYPIAFPSEAGTVYGGTLDVTTGKLTVTMAMVDLGTLNWGIDGTRFKAFVDGMPNKAGRTIKMLCDCYKSLVNGEAYDQNANNVCYGAYGSLYVHDFAYTDASIFRTAVTGHQLCYELATPQTIQLTPQQVELLLGENNLWSDANSINVYVSDGELIDQVTPQKLHTAKGNNTITVDAEVSGINLEVKYWAS